MQQDKDEQTMTFRKPATARINLEALKKDEPKDATEATTPTTPLKEQIFVQDTATPEETEKAKNEAKQMYFYYPKYLHPEAVALIAQHLLNEWEK